MKRRYGMFDGFSGRESGQGTLEYLLILVIMVIIILSLLHQFHRAFRSYATAFFDGYIACLLETGALPGQGANCSSEMPKFDAKNAKGLLKENLPTPGQGGASQRSAGDKAGNGRRREAVGGGRGNSIGSLRGGGRSTSVEVGKLEGGGGKDGGENSNSALSTIPVGRVRPDARGRRSTVDSFREGVIEEDKDKGRPKQSSTKKKVEEGDVLRPVKAFEKDYRKPSSDQTDGGGSFTIGAFVRLLIIILIIVAMVIFFGGQIIQISKSRDKGDG